MTSPGDPEREIDLALTLFHIANGQGFSGVGALFWAETGRKRQFGLNPIPFLPR
jgi:hypothetical protein